jgi:histidine triad (HIT) family protein
LVDEVECIFCRIVKKKENASILYEDEKVMAFLDIKPLNPGHTLVIPKEHWENVYDIPEETIAHLYKIAKRIAILLKKATKAEGINVIQSNELAGNQGIFHFHTHVIPRYQGDKLSKFGPVWESNKIASEHNLKDMEEKIKAFI